MNEIPIDEICWQVQMVCAAVACPCVAILVGAHRKMRREKMVAGAIKNLYHGEGI